MKRSGAFNVWTTEIDCNPKRKKSWTSVPEASWMVAPVLSICVRTHTGPTGKDGHVDQAC